MQKIILPGGNGYLGRALARHFADSGHEVVILSRSAHPDSEKITYRLWDGESLGTWAEVFEGASAVVNLAGRTVNCRYNARNKAQIYESRLRSTRVIGEAISACTVPPPVWINSSSATVYRYALDRPMDEATGEIGTGFSVDVVQKWEQELAAARTSHTRKVALRTAMVFGTGKGGVMDAFQNVVKLGLGGTMASGRQYISWIHLRDFAESIEWIMEHSELEGAINCAAPNPLPNREFLQILRRVNHQPIGLPAARWMLEIGAFVLRTETELLLKSRWVVPGKLLESGYRFSFNHWEEAAKNIVSG